MPIRLSPTGNSPMAKVHKMCWWEFSGHSPNWRKSTILSPIHQWIFANWQMSAGLSLTHLVDFRHWRMSGCFQLTKVLLAKFGNPIKADHIDFILNMKDKSFLAEEFCVLYNFLSGGKFLRKSHSCYSNLMRGCYGH